MKLLGKGFFTRCYDKGAQVELHTFCNIKPAYAELGVGNGVLFPVMKKIDTLYDYEDRAINILTCKKYPKVSSLKNNLKPSHWELYKSLRHIVNELPYNRFENSYDFYRAVESSNILDEFKEEILTAIGDVHNYASCVNVEISPRNVAIDEGNLILLDIFFDKDQLIRVRVSPDTRPDFKTAR